jgi:hypothetical protein
VRQTSLRPARRRMSGVLLWIHHHCSRLTYWPHAVDSRNVPFRAIHSRAQHGRLHVPLHAADSDSDEPISAAFMSVGERGRFLCCNHDARPLWRINPSQCGNPGRGHCVRRRLGVAPWASPRGQRTNSDALHHHVSPRAVLIFECTCGNGWTLKGGRPP